jgi:hypothetical protein
VNDDSFMRSIWRVVTLPMRLLLLGLLWVFAADGSPFRLIPFVAGLLLLSEVIHMISTGQPLAGVTP